MEKITLVTGLWNIGRDNLSEGWSRSFQHYLDRLDKLLEVNTNMIIFGDEELKEFVFKKRTNENTQFITRPSSWFVNNEFYDKIQEIRVKESWYNQVNWLKDSTQAKLDMYNPLVMSKMFLLHDAKILDKFNSDYMFWIDGGEQTQFILDISHMIKFLINYRNIFQNFHSYVFHMKQIQRFMVLIITN